MSGLSAAVSPNRLLSTEQNSVADSCAAFHQSAHQQLIRSLLRIPDRISRHPTVCRPHAAFNAFYDPAALPLISHLISFSDLLVVSLIVVLVAIQLLRNPCALPSLTSNDCMYLLPTVASTEASGLAMTTGPCAGSVGLQSLATERNSKLCGITR